MSEFGAVEPVEPESRSSSCRRLLELRSIHVGGADGAPCARPARGLASVCAPRLSLGSCLGVSDSEEASDSVLRTGVGTLSLGVSDSDPAAVSGRSPRGQGLGDLGPTRAVVTVGPRPSVEVRVVPFVYARSVETTPNNPSVLDELPPAMLTRRQVQRILGASPSFVDRLIARGVLRRFKMGAAVRVHPQDVADYIKSAAKPAR
jgi:excisionase family DNA binding protein